GTSSLPSREDEIYLFRSTYAACHVGLYEDCRRENAAAPFGDGAWGLRWTPFFGPSAGRRKVEPARV
ncbi:MAG: hypothetical protein ACRENK_02905, partial [Gemmatimonadaceae bacterium]